jgi:hypothetical protein
MCDSVGLQGPILLCGKLTYMPRISLTWHWPNAEGRVGGGMTSVGLLWTLLEHVSALNLF